MEGFYNYAVFFNKSNIGHFLQRLSSPFLYFLQHLDLQFSATLMLVRIPFLSLFFFFSFSFLLTF